MGSSRTACLETVRERLGLKIDTRAAISLDGVQQEFTIESPFLGRKKQLP